MKNQPFGEAPVKHLSNATRPKQGVDMDKPEGPGKKIHRKRIRRVLKRNMKAQETTP